MRTILIAALLLSASPALAQPPQPPDEPADSRAVQAFIDKATAPCESKPAQTCVDLGWQFAVGQPKQGMTLADLNALRRRLGAWYAWHKAELPPRARDSIAFGLLLADGMGMDRLHAAFDANGDGKVTQRELLADVKLDRRPLGEVLADPAAVDRAGLAQRLGLPPSLTEGLFQRPPAH
jgi:hypothetical protein